MSAGPATRGRERPAVFLDKDGTLLEDVPYNVDPGAMRLAPGAARGLRMLGRAGFRLVVVSNQSGVARGYFGEEALVRVSERLRAMLDVEGVTLDGFYYCPHLPEGVVGPYASRCHCRKPRPGLLVRAARDLGVDLRASWMVGDILDDVQAGRLAGCRTVLVDSGHETEWSLTPDRVPHRVAVDLDAAARAITEDAVCGVIP